nr:SpaH/EbpB family LPXTG-anchored major pilin [uncultured Solibaculum sp.]
MKTKKVLHQIMACCLVLAVVLSMSLTGFALPGVYNEKGNITVNGINDTTTVSAYQVITVDVDQSSGQPKSPMYYWVEEVANWLKGNETYKAYINDEDNSVTETFKQGADEAFKSFWHDLAAAIKGEDISLTPTNVKAGKDATSVTFAGMEMGQYLLTANGGVKIYQPTTAEVIPAWDEDNSEWILNDATVRVKGEAPTIDKDVETGDDNTVAIGDTVTYKLTVDVPSYPEDATALKFEIGDTLSQGLTLNTSSIKVYSSLDPKTEIPNDSNVAYTLTSEGNTFKIAFTENFLTTTNLTKVYVTYDAIVNENAFATDALGNEAFLGYNNDPYDDSSSQTDGTDKDIYTYGITVTKIDEETQETLSGAEFRLYSDVSCSEESEVKMVSTGANGVYRHATEGESGAVLAVDGNGKLQLQGLDLGTYYLKETKAPGGYTLPKNPMTTIVIGDTEDNTSSGKAPDGTLDGCSLSGPNVVDVKDADDFKIEKNILSFSIWNTNDAGFELPTTGGMGTVIFTVVGLTLMGGAIVLVVLAAKKKKVQN